MTADEQRAKWREQTRRWREANPEKNREVAKRAMAKYSAPKVEAARLRREKRAAVRILAAAQQKAERDSRKASRLTGPEYDHAYYTAHREQYASAAVRWKKANPEKARAIRRHQKKKPEVKMRARSNARLNRYGLSRERHDAMLAATGGTCWACGRPETHVDRQSGRVNSLSIDHDHACCPGDRACGKCVRGLLCDECNRALGCLHDDLDRLAALRMYLTKGVSA